MIAWLDMQSVEQWSEPQMAEQFTAREDLLRQMVGQLYPSILRDEMEVIVAMCSRKFACHPNHFMQRALDRRIRVLA